MIVVLGESGCGKSTLVKRFVNKHPEYRRVITYTTRPKRNGEKNGVDYMFVTEERFNDLIKNQFFAEHSKYNYWSYGTPITECDDNAVAVLTPAGLRALKRKGVNVTSIYISIDRSARMQKLLERGDCVEEAYRRNLSDVGMFDGIEYEVDHIISNPFYIYNETEMLKKFENVLGMGGEDENE